VIGRTSRLATRLNHKLENWKVAKTQHSLAAEPAKLLDVKGVADLLGCSSRHVYRLSDSGRMPRPMKLGQLIRWSKQAIESWIKNGCPSCLEDRK